MYIFTSLSPLSSAGFNATVVLVLLLLAVPLQLFFNHYLEQAYTTASVTDDLVGPVRKAVKDGRMKVEEQEEGIDDVREKALER